MKKFKAFMAAAMAAAAVFTLTSCEELGAGKDYFFGNWDSGFYSVESDGTPTMVTNEKGEEVPGVKKDAEEAYRVQWYFNGNGDSVFNGGKGTFYQIRTKVASYDESKFVVDPSDTNTNEDRKSMMYTGKITGKTFYFGTYTTSDNTGETTGRFNLSYKYGYNLGESPNGDGAYEEKLASLIEMATTQGKSSDNGAAKFVAEMIRDSAGEQKVIDLINEDLKNKDDKDKIKSGLKDAEGNPWVYTKKNLVSLLKYEPLYAPANIEHKESTGQYTGMYSTGNYTLYVQLDRTPTDNGFKYGKELCGDVESFAYEFGEADLTGYRKLTAVSDPADKKCVTINEWAEDNSEYYKSSGCTWSEYKGKKATRILKWKKSAKKGEALDDLDISGLDQ